MPPAQVPFHIGIRAKEGGLYGYWKKRGDSVIDLLRIDVDLPTPEDLGKYKGVHVWKEAISQQAKCRWRFINDNWALADQPLRSPARHVKVTETRMAQKQTLLETLTHSLPAALSAALGEEAGEECLRLLQRYEKERAPRGNGKSKGVSALPAGPASSSASKAEVPDVEGEQEGMRVSERRCNRSAAAGGKESQALCAEVEEQEPQQPPRAPALADYSKLLALADVARRMGLDGEASAGGGGGGVSAELLSGDVRKAAPSQKKRTSLGPEVTGVVPPPPELSDELESLELSGNKRARAHMAVDSSLEPRNLSPRTLRPRTKHVMNPPSSPLQQSVPMEVVEQQEDDDNHGDGEPMTESGESHTQPLELGPGSKSRWDRGVCRGSIDSRPVRRRLTVRSILKAPSIGSEVPLAALLFQEEGVSSLPLGIGLATETSEPHPLVLDIFFDNRKKVGRGQGKLFIYQFSKHGCGAIEAAYHWAMLVEPGLRAKKVEILNSLRARDRDVYVHVRASSGQYHGNSVGLLAALCFVQLMTNCSYCKSGVTGHVTLTGNVYPVGDVDLKYAPLRNRVQKYLYPAGNQSEFDEKVPQGQRGTCKCVPVDNMEQVMIQLVNSSEETSHAASRWRRPSPLVVDKHDTGRMHVPVPVQLRADPNAAEGAETQSGAGAYVDGPILELEACVVPGSGQIRFLCSSNCIPEAEASKVRNWLDSNHETLLLYLKGKLGYAPKPRIDLIKMCFAKDHPRASDSLAEDGSVRSDSIDLCFYTPHLDEKPTRVCAVSMIILIIKIAFGLPLDPKNLSIASSVAATGDMLEVSFQLTDPDLEVALDGLRKLGVRQLVLDKRARRPPDDPLMVAAADLVCPIYPLTVWQVLDLAFFA